MSSTIDKYKLCLYCICLNCKNRENAKAAYSCKIYPKRYGIPPKVWNDKDTKCEHYEPKQLNDPPKIVHRSTRTNRTIV